MRPTAEAVSTALNVLEAKAQFDGSAEPVYVRVAPDGDNGLYVDLGDPAWRAIHVTAAGWEIVADPPVSFIRAAGALALPEPIGGGSLDDLRGFVNVTDEDWPLLKAFLRGCLNPHGPYPVLALNGEQGSAKSTTARMLRSLVDPRLPDLRAEPREARDLAIAARGSWIVAYDNVSHVAALAVGRALPARDGRRVRDSRAVHRLRRGPLRRAATVDPHRHRGLHRQGRPAGPHGPGHPRHDPRERRRKPERVLWAAFEAARPRLLGALLADISAALGALADVRLDRLPRMADFALWAVAAERGRGEPPRFMPAYAKARAAGHEQAIEASPIGAPLLAFIAGDLQQGSWQTTAAELLKRLAELGGEAATRQKEWPRSPRGLSGMLRGLAPALRATGVVGDFRYPRGARPTPASPP